MSATSRLARLTLFLILLFSASSVLGLKGQTESDISQIDSVEAPQATDTTAAATGSADVATSQGGISADSELIAQGEQIFNQNCRACHAVDRDLVGPALAGVHDRRDMDWIKAFVRNSQAVIASGDQYAVDLFEKYNRTVMTSFNLSDEDIEAVVAYIRAEEEKAAAPAAADSEVGDAATAAPAGPSKYITAIMVGLVVVLGLILIVLVLIISFLTKFLKERKDLDEEDREVVEQRFNLKKLTSNPGFIGIVAFIFGIFVVKSVIDGLYQVGIQQGYAPQQPIAFSHKLHAGQYEIDCNYCHTGVRKSKSANIPSANICMNCHGQIKTESPEIQKIYAAIEENRPIQWVRVHNLPDLAYFNHAQHVDVGNQECQTCHGPIEEMEVVEQFAPLTMGWCINCHQETNVNTRDNAYYDNLVQLHAQHSDEPLKVEDIGGLECSKCHY